VTASDGFGFGTWVSFTVSAPVDSGQPVVTVTPPQGEVPQNHILQASSLFSATDHAGAQVETFEVWQAQSGTGAHFDLNGTPVPGYNQNIDVAASQLSSLTFVSGASAGTDVLWVRANDGVLWTAWQSFAVVTDPPPGNAANGAAINIQDGALSEVTGASSSAANFLGSTGTLQLDDAQGFTGTISGFTGADRIDLVGIMCAGASFDWQASADGTGGTLSVTDGALTAKLALLGQYVAANFSLGVDGHGGTIVNDPPVLFGPVAPSVDPGTPAPTAADRPTSVPMFDPTPPQVR
jgi:hypothetical protein